MGFPEALKITICRKTGKNENFMLHASRASEVFKNFVYFKNVVVERYPKLVQFEEIRFFWIDEEGDEICIASQADYFDYMSSCETHQQKRRIFVSGEESIDSPITTAAPVIPMEQSAEQGQENTATPTSPTTSVEYPVHANIICDVCDSTIHGHRYKCTQCFNYDLCMKCESKFRHKDHVMIRIPKPDVYRSVNPLFQKLRTFVEVEAVPDADDYENSKRSKRHHRRHSKDREECREEKERNERAQRRERAAKYAEERRNAHYRRHVGDRPGNFKHLIQQIIDPANIQSTIFASTDAALAAAAAATEAAAQCAQQAVHATVGNCPLFTTSSKTTTTTSNGNTATATTTATTTATSTNVTEDKPEQPSAPSSASEEPQGTKASATPTQASVQKEFDFSWFAPTPENLQKINQTFSRMLDPLGMNIEIRSNDSSPKPAQTQTSTEEKQDKTTETPNTPTTSTPSQTVPANGANKSTEMDPMTELEKQLERAFEDTDCSSVSSVSMLSDNEDHDDGVNKATTKKWTLVDMPDDQDEPMKQVSATSAEVPQQAKEAVEPIPSTSSPQTVATPATPASVPEPASVSSAKIVEQKPIDYEQLGKALKQHLEAEQKAVGTFKPAVVSETPREPPKETTPPAPANKPATNPQFVYSQRPHVNRAVHTMMAMGFSNEGGWLLQLLESVNGDIPRAIDHLTPHKTNP